MNIEYFLSEQLEKYKLDEIVRTVELYKNISNSKERELFAIMHQRINYLIKFMYSKRNGHFNADESRELISYIELYENMKYVLKGTEYDFDLLDEYKAFLDTCKLFLLPSGGSQVPRDLKKIILIEYEPIFRMINSIETSNHKETKRYELKLIGEGSYAQVFKYKDEFYDHNYVVKRAKRGLTSEELIRFKNEYEIMKNMNSPNILTVYRYSEEANEYYAEYADETLYQYITKNNDKLTKYQRKRLAFQVFNAFSYIHSKKLLHRDISLTNVLLKHYEDVSIIKISDFGLVKELESNLTKTDTEVKGSLNDSNLSIIGFKNYSIEYETYALTRLIFFIMTGKRNIEDINDDKVKTFVLKGIDANIKNRYKSIEEMVQSFRMAFE